ncbi:MAG: TAT-variant-translocated molybdopterin oxidoreductase [Candidatus Marinimicrobia bacterium]|nr:TAT-variant-translocated molybdopterin oxidoreductase [Candidatus Neomarinimicrobiota bacterium]
MTKHEGKTYWRSLNQLADTAEFRQFMENEFPEVATELNDPVSRRSFLSLMGASLALAGLAGCRRPVEKIIPYVVGQENIVPGIPKFYSTTMPFGLENIGVLVENHEGRPTKLEGNPQHPASLGAANSFVQSAILNLYDPDRSQSVLKNGIASNWDNFISHWRSAYSDFKGNGGEGLAVLSEAFASPTLARLKAEFSRQFPKARWVTWDPISDENIYDGIKAATGNIYQPHFRLNKAQVILALDSDFLHLETDAIANTKGFAEGRQVKSENDSMNRLYVVEPGFTVTGGMADHRLNLPASQVPAFILALAHELQNQGLALPSGIKLPAAEFTADRKWIKAVAKDLLVHRSQNLIVAGRRQPAQVHALVLLLNSALGNTGKTIDYYQLKDAELPSTPALASLVNDMEAGEIDYLIMLSGNPVYNAPADLNLTAALRKVKTTLHLSSHVDETSQLSNWHIPNAHFLEAWGDATSLNGTKSIIQPQIKPLFGAISAVELLSLLASGEKSNGYDLVKETWRKLLVIFKDKFENQWRKSLHDGIVGMLPYNMPGSSLPAPYTRLRPTANPPLLKNGSTSLNGKSLENDFFWYLFGLNAKKIETYLYDFSWQVTNVNLKNIEVVFNSSSTTFDGRFANNGWLQEMPDPITKLTWDNAVIINRKTAAALKVTNYDVIEIAVNGRTLSAPVWIVPGQADFTISLDLGYGREAAGRIGTGVGVDAYRLRTSDRPYILSGASITKTNATYELACTQDHHGLDLEKLAADAIQDRLPVLYREATLDEYRKHPDFVSEVVEHPPLKSLWQEKKYDEGYQWGMTIDLNTCTGCNACSIACQSENNIPIVGKEEVAKGREMAWLRMDRYFSGPEESPEIVHQPLACQHCENAPCEQVCPVAATVHDAEGLNVMTYNRCVGTRYCANNCPYKVRRFNFFNYTKDTPDIVEMVMNPDVTVRSRGVMEKCSFCVQRISLARIGAKNENREIRDGEVQSACQQSCPADAIVFGNINDPNSRISQTKSQNRNYALLGELNTKPRLTYLAKLRNPNPELVS